jgi:hypothetical protein
MSADIKAGDRLRVTTEVEVLDPAPIRWNGLTGLRASLDGEAVRVVIAPSVSVEKIEPPVEAFQPGDFVKNRAGGRLYYLGTNQYLRLHETEGTLGTNCPYGVGYTRGFFTSEFFEKVNLEERPF